MNNIVTMDELININDMIFSNVSKYKEQNHLLEPYIYNQFDIIGYKDQLLNLFATFKSARYLYDFPIDVNTKIITDYELHEGYHQNNVTSQVENAVERVFDKQILTTDIYHSVVKLSYKLTHEESIYFINTFLTHKSEDDIAEIIGISKTYLQKIKKSCIVKMWTELKKYCEND